MCGMTSQEAAALVPQALIPLVESGYFTTKDLGRLLVRTCKAITIAGLGRDRNAVWKQLCFSHCGMDNAKSLLETVAPICVEKLNDQLEVPRPLVYTRTPQDYILIWIAEMRERTTDEPILYKAIPGQDIPELFNNGKASIEFEEPLVNTEVHEDKNERFDWDMSLHILRRLDQRVERLMAYDSWSESIDEELDKDRKSGNFVCEGHARFSTPFAMTGLYGLELLDRVFSIREVDCLVVEFNPICCLIGPKSVGIYGFDVNVGIQKTVENGDFSVSFAAEELEEKDGTFAHFLEALMEH